MFRVMEMRGGAFPERTYSEHAPGHLPENFNRLIVTDTWEIDMDTAQVSMGEQARLLHKLAAGGGSIGLMEYLSAYRDDHAREITRLIEHAIESTSPFFYAGLLREAPHDTVVGIGEPQGSTIRGMFLAARYPTISFTS